MKDLDEHGRNCEEAFGLISGCYVFALHEIATAAGAKWDISDPDTMEIPVTKRNAECVYAYCKEIRSGYSVGLTRWQMSIVKAARKEAHEFLYIEANDPKTPIERKIELVKLTSK